MKVLFPVKIFIYLLLKNRNGTVNRYLRTHIFVVIVIYIKSCNLPLFFKFVVIFEGNIFFTFHVELQLFNTNIDCPKCV